MKHGILRSVPYAPKGGWKLPFVGKPAESAELAPVEDGWGSSPQTPAINVPKNWRRLRSLPQWKKQMFALKEKFPTGWSPPKKLDRDQMEHLRLVKQTQPGISMNELGTMFKISPEAARRIVKSRWQPTPEEAKKMANRWHKRGEKLGARTMTKKPQNKRVFKSRKVDQEIF